MYETQETKYAIRNEQLGLTGKEFATVAAARAECGTPGDEVVEMHYNVTEGRIMFRHEGTARTPTPSERKMVENTVAFLDSFVQSTTDKNGLTRAANTLRTLLGEE